MPSCLRRMSSIQGHRIYLQGNSGFACLHPSGCTRNTRYALANLTAPSLPDPTPSSCQRSRTFLSPSQCGSRQIQTRFDLVHNRSNFVKKALRRLASTAGMNLQRRILSLSTGWCLKWLDSRTSIWSVKARLPQIQPWLAYPYQN
jgi:hypothetical protein